MDSYAIIYIFIKNPNVGENELFARKLQNITSVFKSVKYLHLHSHIPPPIFHHWWRTFFEMQVEK